MSPEFRARDIRLLVLDVDGVLTDGTLWFGDAGEVLKAFNIRDGHGIKLLAAAGIRTAIVTGKRSGAVAARAADLGIDLLHMGVDDKRAALAALLAETGLPTAACAGIGDDVQDLPLLTRCGLAACVPEAPTAVRERVHYVTCTPGGRGAVRELAEFVLRAQGRLDAVLARYLD